LVFATIALFHSPSRAYIDPWTGDYFGEGGVEKDLHKVPQQQVVRGGVIMSKLGNTTAK
jgi:FAD-linked sulfhydryl oxidase